jgi:hypothetical protein
MDCSSIETAIGSRCGMQISDDCAQRIGMGRGFGRGPQSTDLYSRHLVGIWDELFCCTRARWGLRPFAGHRYLAVGHGGRGTLYRLLRRDIMEGSNAAPDVTAVIVMSDRLSQHHYRRKDQLHGSHEHGRTCSTVAPRPRRLRPFSAWPLRFPSGSVAILDAASHALGKA